MAISSLAEMAQHITVQCLGERGGTEARKITLAAGQTMVVDACATSGTVETDFASAYEHKPDEGRGPVGIRLTSDAMPGSFAAFALVPHGNDGERSFSSVPFSDPKTLHSPNTVFTGVPVGSATLLPGTYTPQISLTNFSASEVHVHTSFAKTFDGYAVTREVGSITVPPGTSRKLVLKDLEGDPTLQNSFVVYSDGAPGALMAKLVSKSDARLPQVELQAKDALDENNSGGHPWSIKQGVESTLLLFNHGDKAQVFTVSVSGSDVWQKAYTLSPMQTKAVSIRSLIEDQVKDDNGKTLPRSASSGEISWLAADTTQVSGRLLQSNRSTGMARNFSCGVSGLLCGANLQTYTTTLPDGEIESYGQVTAVTCTSGAQNACSGQPTGSSQNFDITWSSQYTNIASVSGLNKTPGVSLLGMSAGSSNISAYLKSAYCSAGGGGPVTVQQPGKLYVKNDTTQSQNCPGRSLVARLITYQITDTTGSAMLFPVDIRENVPAVTSSCTSAPVATGTSCFLNSSVAPGSTNLFIDALSAGCPTSSAPSPCGFTFPNQQWQWCKSDGTTPSIGTIGQDIVNNTSVSVGGNTVGLTGTFFNP